ncbi:hypothetical protein PUM22_RS25100, partial [Escherichia coli]
RHLDTCQFTTIVEADVPRIMCRSTSARRCQFPGLAPEAGIRCCSNRSPYISCGQQNRYNISWSRYISCSE